MGKKITEDIAREMFEGKYPEWKLIEFNGNHGACKLQDSAGHIVEYSDFQAVRLRGPHCDICKKDSYNNWKYNIGDMVYGNRIIIDRKFENSAQWYRYKCLDCGFDCTDCYVRGKYHDEYWVHVSDIAKHKCGVCNSNMIVAVGINDINTTHPYMNKYFVNETDKYKYSFGSNCKVDMQCPECGNVQTNTIGVVYSNGFSCKNCSDNITFPNKMIRGVLNQFQLDCIEFEYCPSWLKKLPYCIDGEEYIARYCFYDVYFEHNNRCYAVEMDGGVGHGKKQWHKKDTDKKGIALDLAKDKAAAKQGVEVIRIDCDYKDASKRFEHIQKSIRESKLSNVLDLSLINWAECMNFVSSNLMKDVCTNWIDGQSTLVEFQAKYHIDTSTIRTYLKKGRELGWCNYIMMTEKYQTNKLKVGELWETLNNIDKIVEITNIRRETVYRYLGELYKENKTSFDPYKNKHEVEAANGRNNRGRKLPSVTGELNYISRRVYCITENEAFGSIKQAADYYGIYDTAIGQNIRGRQKAVLCKKLNKKLDFVVISHEDFLRWKEHGMLDQELIDKLIEEKSAIKTSIDTHSTNNHPTSTPNIMQNVETTQQPLTIQN